MAATLPDVRCHYLGLRRRVAQNLHVQDNLKISVLPACRQFIPYCAQIFRVGKQAPRGFSSELLDSRGDDQ